MIRSTTRIGAKSRRRQLKRRDDGAGKHRGGEDTGTAAARRLHSGGWPRLLLPERASDLKATAQANLVYLPGRPIGRLQRL